MKNYDERWTAESARLDIFAQSASQISISFSLSFSLYQYLIFLSRSPQGSENYPADERWQQAADRVAHLYYPLGPLNFFEFSMAESETVSELGENLQTRARFFGEELFSSIKAVENLYRDTLWPEHRHLLSDALTQLKELLAPYKEALLSLQAERFGLKKQFSSYQVTLVPVTYERAGGYSHPTVVSVAKFRGLSLVEAIIHELTHVIADLNKSNPDSAYQVLKEYCSLKNRPGRDSLQLFHLLIHHATGSLVREVISPDYVPYAESTKLYARAGSILSANLSVEMLTDIWLAWTQHRCDLETAMKNLVDAAIDR